MAIQSSVTISLVPEARGGPFIFWDDLEDGCRKAKQLGFDAVEVFPPARTRSIPIGCGRCSTTRAWRWRRWARAPAGSRRGCTSACLTPRAAHEAQAFIKAIIDFSGPLHAPVIIGSMQGRSGDGIEHATALGYLSDALEVLGEYAKQYGILLIYEPLNRYETNLANTIEAGMTLLQSLSTRNIVLLADLFHMNIEESDLAAAIHAGDGYIGHLHFVDSNRRPGRFRAPRLRPDRRGAPRHRLSRLRVRRGLPLPRPG